MFLPFDNGAPDGFRTRLAMHSFLSRFSRRSLFAHLLVLLAAGGLLGACDRHSADELPESYGHGSSHNKSYDRHETDSRSGSKHFSDSKGLDPGKAKEAVPEPTAKPGATESGRMFPTDK